MKPLTQAPGSEGSGPPQALVPLLIVDTASRPGFIGLWNLGRWLDMEQFSDGRRQGEELFPLFEKLLAANDLCLRQLQAIVVAKGPGSFSALRVGLCAAKSLSESAGLRVAGVSLLDAAACHLPGHSRVVCLAASRGETFIGHYGSDNRPLGAPVVSALDLWNLPSSFEPEALLVLSATEAQMALGSPRLSTLPATVIGAQMPDLLAAEGARRVSEGDFDDPMLLDALYVRRDDADGAWTDRSAG